MYPKALYLSTGGHRVGSEDALAEAVRDGKIGHQVVHSYEADVQAQKVGFRPAESIIEPVLMEEADEVPDSCFKELSDGYEQKYGQKPHHRMKPETIRAAL